MSTRQAFRVWPDGTILDADSEPPAWMSDDYEHVLAHEAELDELAAYVHRNGCAIGWNASRLDPLRRNPKGPR
jgi:hypothetical protein